MTTVDQQKTRRARTGLIAHDPALAQPGYTLFAPMYGDGTVDLVGMDGNVAHTWHMPYRPGLYGHLLDNGHLFYGGKIMEDLERFEAWPRFKGGAVLEADWRGRILWEVRHRDHHHDARCCATATSCSCACGRSPPNSPAASGADCRAAKPAARSTPIIWSR